MKRVHTHEFADDQIAEWNKRQTTINFDNEFDNEDRSY